MLLYIEHELVFHSVVTVESPELCTIFCSYYLLCILTDLHLFNQRMFRECYASFLIGLSQPRCDDEGSCLPPRHQRCGHNSSTNSIQARLTLVIRKTSVHFQEHPLWCMQCYCFTCVATFFCLFLNRLVLSAWSQTYQLTRASVV